MSATHHTATTTRPLPTGFTAPALDALLRELDRLADAGRLTPTFHGHLFLRWRDETPGDTAPQPFVIDPRAWRSWSELTAAGVSVELATEHILAGPR